METIVRALGDALVPWGYVLLGLVTALEAAAFLGLFVPGESALLFAGVLASRGDLDLAVAMTVAAAGAVVGDSIGYEVGRHGGERLRSTRLGHKVGAERWDRARDFVRRHGGVSVLLGRWIGVLRALVPAVVGDSRMPYRRFLLWNASGALLWAPAVVGAGYLAGSSWNQVEQNLGRGSLIALGALSVVAVIAWVEHRRRNGDRSDSASDRDTPAAGAGGPHAPSPPPGPHQPDRSGPPPAGPGR